MTEEIKEEKKDYLPPPRSGFVAGTCHKCRRPTFSKGKINKHKCK